MDLKPTWDDIRRKINGLWPKFEPTDAERALIASRLSSLNTRWLDAAVDEYRCESSSPVFRIAELLEIYKRIANHGERPERKAVADRSREQERMAIEAEAEEARRWLSSLPRDEVARTVAELRAMRWIGDGKLPPRIEEWRANTAMMVMARIRMTARQGKEDRHG